MQSFKLAYYYQRLCFKMRTYLGILGKCTLESLIKQFFDFANFFPNSYAFLSSKDL